MSSIPGQRTPARGRGFAPRLGWDAAPGTALLDQGFNHPDFRFQLDATPGYYSTIAEMQEFGEQVPWPMFTGNELGEIAVAARAAQVLWGVDFVAEMARRPRDTTNLFVAMAEPRTAERLVNWEEILRHFVALFKAVPASQSMLESPGALFTEGLGAFATSNPHGLLRLFELWQTAPARDAIVRWIYPVVWREPGYSDIRVHGIVTPESEPLGIGFNEWIPVDAASHATGGGAGEPRQRVGGSGVTPSLIAPRAPGWDVC